MGMGEFILKNYQDTFAVLVQKKFLFTMMVLLDVCLLLGVSFTVAKFVPVIVDDLVDIGQAMNPELPGLTDEGMMQENLMRMSSLSPFVREKFESIASVFWNMVLSISLVVIIFQLVSFWLAFKMFMKRKKSFVNYMVKYFCLSVFWLFIIALIFYFLIDSFVASVVELAPSIAKSWTISLLSSLSIVVAYFSLLSYSFIMNHKLLIIFKKTFTVGFVDIIRLFFLFASAIVPIIISVVLFSILSESNFIISLFILILLILPSLSFARVHIFRSFSKLNE